MIQDAGTVASSFRHPAEAHLAILTQGNAPKEREHHLHFYDLLIMGLEHEERNKQG